MCDKDNKQIRIYYQDERYTILEQCGYRNWYVYAL